jgi:hypothetical protein
MGMMKCIVGLAMPLTMTASFLVAWASGRSYGLRV